MVEGGSIISSPPLGVFANVSWWEMAKRTSGLVSPNNLAGSNFHFLDDPPRDDDDTLGILLGLDGLLASLLAPRPEPQH